MDDRPGAPIGMGRRPAKFHENLHEPPGFSLGAGWFFAPVAHGGIQIESRGENHLLGAIVVGKLYPFACRSREFPGKITLNTLKFGPSVKPLSKCPLHSFFQTVMTNVACLRRDG